MKIQKCYISRASFAYQILAGRYLYTMRGTLITAAINAKRPISDQVLTLKWNKKQKLA